MATAASTPLPPAENGDRVVRPVRPEGESVGSSSSPQPPQLREHSLPGVTQAMCDIQLATQSPSPPPLPLRGHSLSGVTQPMDSPNTRPLILLPQTKKTSKHHKTAHKENSVKVQRPESAKNVRNIFDFFLGKILTGI